MFASAAVAPAADATLAAIVISLGAVSLVLAFALYVWTALALSRLFGRMGEAAWKGWIPVVNTGTVYSLGRYPAWFVVFLFIPVVNLYGLYVYIVVTHRINRRFEHGAGSTILAVLLPPVWASILAWGGQDPDVPRGRAVAPASGTVVATTSSPVAVQRADPAVTPRDASGYAIPIAEAALPVQAVQDPAAPPASAAPAPPIAAAEATVVVPRTPEPTPAPEPAAAPEPVPAPRWHLLLEDGTAIVLTSERIVLGRNPGAVDGAQAVAIRDSTRTLSKTHARLDLVDGGWLLTDLDSTNGVLLLDAAGAETQIDSGAAVPVVGGFILGDLPVRLEQIAAAV